MNPIGGAGVLPASGQSFSDFGGQAQRTRTAMAATTPTLPEGSGNRDTFGAAGSAAPSAARASMGAGGAVRGLLMLIGLLVVLRVVYEMAEDATD